MDTNQAFIVRTHLIDDNAIFRVLFDIILSDFSECRMEVFTYENALDFLDKFTYYEIEPNTLNILFVDINMPFMTGWELIEKLGLNRPAFILHNPVYIISSSTSKSDTEKEKTYSFLKGYVLKPIHKDLLFDIIKKYIPKVGN